MARERLHASLRWRTHLVLLLLWLALVLVALATRPDVARLVPLGLLLGAIGGAMQAAAMHARPAEFRAARTAIAVRKALADTRWGRGYLVYFWLCNLTFMVVTILRRPPQVDSWIALVAPLLALYGAFAAARECVTILPARALETAA